MKMTKVIIICLSYNGTDCHHHSSHHHHTMVIIITIITDNDIWQTIGLALDRCMITSTTITMMIMNTTLHFGAWCPTVGIFSLRMSAAPNQRRSTMQRTHRRRRHHHRHRRHHRHDCHLHCHHRNISFYLGKY